MHCFVATVIIRHALIAFHLNYISTRLYVHQDLLVSYNTSDLTIQPVRRLGLCDSTATNAALYLMLHCVCTGNANGLS